MYRVHGGPDGVPWSFCVVIFMDDHFFYGVFPYLILLLYFLQCRMKEETQVNAQDARTIHQTNNPRNQDGIGEKELLVVSFGTSYLDSCRLTIGAIEDALERVFPGYDLRRSFTSQMIINHIQRRDGISIDNVTQALNRAVSNGVKHLVIQPTHIMDGFEYQKLTTEAARYQDAFVSLSVGAPLLTSDEDFRIVADALAASVAAYDDGKTAICFMGHGTESAANEVYERMQKKLADSGRDNYFIGTVEATPTVEKVLSLVKAGNYKRVLLQPMMIVAGDHANNDMAGEEEGSWKRIFESAGYEVVCQVHGLGELEAIQNLFVKHAKAAIEVISSLYATRKRN